MPVQWSAFLVSAPLIVHLFYWDVLTFLLIDLQLVYHFRLRSRINICNYMPVHLIYIVHKIICRNKLKNSCKLLTLNMDAV